MKSELNRRILVIDDNRAIHDDFRKILCRRKINPNGMADLEGALFGVTADSAPGTDFEIESAYQGAEGLELVRQAVAAGRPYAVAFVDVRMPPGWDGIETTSQIWKVDPELQIVVCTAYSDYSWEDMLAKVGRSDRLVILKKPFDNVEALQLAEALTTKWRLSREAKRKLNDLEQMVRERTIEATTVNEALRDEITQHTQTENQLRLQTSALEAAPNGIVITDRAGKIIWVNLAFTQLTGYSASEVIGLTPAMLKSGAHGQSFYKNLWDTILAGNVWQGELVNRRKDGSLYHEEMTVTPVRNDQREIQNFVAIKQDISQRKKFEQDLAHERDLLQSLMDNLPDYIYFKDAHSRFTRVNHAHARHLGLNGPEEAIGKSDMDYFPIRAARQKFVEEQRLIATGEPLLGLIEESESARGKSWVSSTKVPLRDANGQITGLVGISRDITKFKLAEEAMHESEARYHSLFENMLEGFARCRMLFEEGKPADFVYLEVNTAFETLTGLKDVVGKNASEVIPGIQQSNAELIEIYARVALTGKPERVETFVAPLGIWFSIAVYRYSPRGVITTNAHPVRETNGATTPVGCSVVSHGANPSPDTSAPRGERGDFVAIFDNITAAKQAEEARRMMEVQLRQGQKLEAIGQLAAGIAHEINTPTQYVGDNTRFLKDSFQSITAMLHAYGELLAAAKKNALTPELIAQAERAAAAGDLKYLFEQIPAAIKESIEGVDRISKIVRAMKEFSHPGGKERTAADLNRAIESTTTVARNEWKYVAELKLELDPSLPLVPCFLGEFNQCILNLVVNAAHAIGDAVASSPGSKGLITVSTRRDGGCVEIRVSDTGTGIPEAVRPHIFEPFFTTKGVGKGTGQGLSIVYTNIVKKHGGSVSFESEPGRGTSFILRLPLTANPGSPRGVIITDADPTLAASTPPGKGAKEVETKKLNREPGAQLAA